MSSVCELQPSTTVTAIHACEIDDTMTKQDRDLRELLSALTLEEKVRLLSGESFTAAAGVKRLNIPPIKASCQIPTLSPPKLTQSTTRSPTAQAASAPHSTTAT
jgi:hypothetical protein